MRCFQLLGSLHLMKLLKYNLLSSKFCCSLLHQYSARTIVAENNYRYDIKQLLSYCKTLDHSKLKKEFLFTLFPASSLSSLLDGKYLKKFSSYKKIKQLKLSNTTLVHQNTKIIKAKSMKYDNLLPFL